MKVLDCLKYFTTEFGEPSMITAVILLMALRLLLFVGCWDMSMVKLIMTRHLAEEKDQFGCTMCAAKETSTAFLIVALPGTIGEITKMM